MNLPCKVVCDLLPLYHDAVCSEESKAMVETHLQTCEGCTDALRHIEEELTAPHITPESEKVKKAMSFAWKKAKKKSFVKGILLAALLCGLLVGAFVALTQWKIIPVPASLLEVTDLATNSDGSLVFRLVVHDKKNLFLTKFTTTDDGCYYLTPMRSVIETTSNFDVGALDNVFHFYPAGYDGERTYPGFNLPDTVTKLYVGPVGEGTLFWEVGTPLPAAKEPY